MAVGITYTLALLVNIWYDSGRYGTISGAGHAARATLRLLLFLFLSAWMLDFEGYYSVMIVKYTVYMAAGWWLLFNLLLNIVGMIRNPDRNLKPWHVGTTAKTDRLFWWLAGGEGED